MKRMRRVRFLSAVHTTLVLIMLMLFSTATQAYMPILPEHSGSWYNPNQDGHGLSVEVLDDGVVIAYWYTYAPGGHAIWVIGIGAANGDTVVMDAYAYQGMEWGEWDPNDKDKFDFGTMTIKVKNCDELTFSYDSVITYGDTPLGSGTIPMARLASIDNQKCSTSPLTGTYLLAGIGGGEVGMGLAIIGPDGRFIGLVGSDANGAIIRGTIEGTGSGTLSAVVNAYRLNGGYVGWGQVTGTWGIGQVVLNDRNGDPLFGVRDQASSMSDPTLYNGSFRITDQFSGNSGTIRVTNGIVTGSIFGCTINGDATLQDSDFDQVWLDIDLTGCSKAGRFQGAGTAEVILLSDGYQGFGWTAE